MCLRTLLSLEDLGEFLSVCTVVDHTAAFALKTAVRRGGLVMSSNSCRATRQRGFQKTRGGEGQKLRSSENSELQRCIHRSIFQRFEWSTYYTRHYQNGKTCHYYSNSKWQRVQRKENSTQTREETYHCRYTGETANSNRATARRVLLLCCTVYSISFTVPNHLEEIIDCLR